MHCCKTDCFRHKVEGLVRVPNSHSKPSMSSLRVWNWDTTSRGNQHQLLSVPIPFRMLLPRQQSQTHTNGHNLQVCTYCKGAIKKYNFSRIKIYYFLLYFYLSDLTCLYSGHAVPTYTPYNPAGQPSYPTGQTGFNPGQTGFPTGIQQSPVTANMGPLPPSHPNPINPTTSQPVSIFNPAPPPPQPVPGTGLTSAPPPSVPATKTAAPMTRVGAISSNPLSHNSPLPTWNDPPTFSAKNKVYYTDIYCAEEL